MLPYKRINKNDTVHCEKAFGYQDNNVSYRLNI